MSQLLQLRLEKNLSEYTYSQSELKYVRLQFEIYNKRFMDDFREDITVAGNRKMFQDDGQPSGSFDCEESLVHTPELPDFQPRSAQNRLELYFSKLYKKLVLLCHPDKNPDKADVFDELQQAHDLKEYVQILLIAKQLGVSVQTDKLDIDELEKSISEITRRARQKISDIRNSFAWVWCQEYSSAEEREGLRQNLSTSIRQQT